MRARVRGGPSSDIHNVVRLSQSFLDRLERRLNVDPASATAEAASRFKTANGMGVRCADPRARVDAAGSAEAAGPFKSAAAHCFVARATALLC